MEAITDKANPSALSLRHSARVKSSAPEYFFYHWDHLGTARLITNNSGNIASRHDFEPFGVEIPPYNETASNTHKFTGHERDNSTGYDYMHFRYYGSNLGRFIKPDNVTGSPLNPQNWNLYSYVNGNPVIFNDPTGHDFRGNQGKTGMSFALAGVPDVDISGGLTPEVCESKSEKSGLQAAVFYNSTTGEYVVAFAGVNGWNDVKTSIRQMTTGHSLQFSQVPEYFREVSKRYDCTPTLVGHSLGGGLAAAVAVQLGLQARTFNAEGVNARTVKGRAVLARAKDLVINYFTSGDWLTILQRLTPLPNPAGQQIYVGDGGHGIRWFLIGR